ncbi:hypothetical protein JCM11641_008110 [Rhodosporidiobolus odoratus]
MSLPPRLNDHDTGYLNLEGSAPPTRRLGGYQAQPQMAHDPFYDGSSSSHSGSSPGGSRSRYDLAGEEGHGDVRHGVQSGAIGGDYGPYSPSSPSYGPSRYTPRHSSRPSPFVNMNMSTTTLSAPPSPSLGSSPQAVHNLQQHRLAAARAAAAGGPGAASAPTLASRAIPVYTAKDAEYDEKLHSLSPGDQYVEAASCTAFSFRGVLNLLALFAIVVALITLFAGYPLIQWATRQAMGTYGAFGLGGTNSSGQVPNIPGLPGLIDKDTPPDALTRTGFDGKKYVLTFSDEFNTNGRTFWPGDDPYWEAVDLHYWPTNDYEWYDPDALTTEDGNLVITMTQEPWRGMNFRSGMLQSWNKLCFTGGYIEVNISLPGANGVGGLWPGAWTLGNLGRAGYGATSDGTWPYSYSECDIGTLPNQTNVAGTGPASALTSGYDGGSLSFQPGQRLSACTCAGGDHPGPSVKVGRGAPEIDIIEAQMSYDSKAKKLRGAASQSAQFAPYDDAYEFRNSTPYTTVYSSDTELNSYKGGVYQQATSGVTYTNQNAYELSGGGFETYGFEYDTGKDDGYITWISGGKPDWQLTAGAVGPNAAAGIGQRLISQEPMYIILNLGISDSFQTIDYHDLVFPAKMKIDYVRIYQQEGKQNMGCDPKDMPTSKYIKDHLNAYSDANLTLWSHAGYDYPKNSLQGC